METGFKPSSLCLRVCVTIHSAMQLHLYACEAHVFAIERHFHSCRCESMRRKRNTRREYSSSDSDADIGIPIRPRIASMITKNRVDEGINYMVNGEDNDRIESDGSDEGDLPSNSGGNFTSSLSGRCNFLSADVRLRAIDGGPIGSDESLSVDLLASKEVIVKRQAACSHK
ncbi:hypothetical protein Y032_0466g1979 [Ancylostoma ceylanicum]|uniref:Uncharacterized protein n=1 Tax=Ancylostoma ceylanicum TaxID=53326 RepID=A0A016WX97_9BILA|nr:hypothetical protein Y032_0466g1979 [Ancylostoma ceylanicum]